MPQLIGAQTLFKSAPDMGVDSAFRTTARGQRQFDQPLGSDIQRSSLRGKGPLPNWYYTTMLFRMQTLTRWKLKSKFLN